MAQHRRVFTLPMCRLSEVIADTVLWKGEKIVLLKDGTYLTFSSKLGDADAIAAVRHKIKESYKEIAKLEKWLSTTSP